VFSYAPGAASPAAQALSIGGGLPFTVTTGSAGGWLSVTPLSGAAPATLTVSVNPAGLASGTYSGVILIVSNTDAGSTSQNGVVSIAIPGSPTQTVPVTLEVKASVPFIGSLVNAASLLSSPLAPGEIVSVFGRGLGPVDSANLRITASSVIDNLLAGTRAIVN